MNIIIQIYMIMCVILLVFDIGFLLTKNINKMKFFKKNNKFEKLVKKEIKKREADGEFSMGFLIKLPKELSKTQNLVALQNILNENQDAKVWFKSVIFSLVDVYKQKSDYDQAFYIYVVSTLGYNEPVPADFASQFFGFLDSKSLYTFSNTMDALYAFSEEGLLVSAVDKVNEREGFYHKKLFVDGLLTSNVDKESFIKKLIERFDTYNVHTKEALLDYFRMTNVDVSEFCMKLLNLKSSESEIVYACMRYFVKKPNAASKEYSLNVLKTETADWVKQMLAIQALKTYNDNEVVSAVKSKITDRNWYVRINALEYLVANGLDSDDIKEIIELNDKYAMETLLYLFKNDEEKSKLISEVLEKAEKTVEEGVTV